MHSRHHNILSSAVFLGISAFVYYQTYTRFVVRQAVGGGPFANSAFFPRVVAGAMALLSLILLIKNLINPSEKDSEVIDQGITPPRPTDLAAESGELKKPSAVQVVSVAALLLAYTVALPLFGYLVTTPLLMIGLFLLLGVRRPLTLILLTVGSAGMIYLLFSEVLNVILPRGRIW